MGIQKILGRERGEEGRHATPGDILVISLID